MERKSVSCQTTERHWRFPSLTHENMSLISKFIGCGILIGIIESIAGPPRTVWALVFVALLLICYDDVVCICCKRKGHCEFNKNYFPRNRRRGRGRFYSSNYLGKRWDKKCEFGGRCDGSDEKTGDWCKMDSNNTIHLSVAWRVLAPPREV